METDMMTFSWERYRPFHGVVGLCVLIDRVVLGVVVVVFGVVVVVLGVVVVVLRVVVVVVLGVVVVVVLVAVCKWIAKWCLYIIDNPKYYCFQFSIQMLVTPFKYMGFSHLRLQKMCTIV